MMNYDDMTALNFNFLDKHMFLKTIAGWVVALVLFYASNGVVTIGLLRRLQTESLHWT